MNDFAQDLTGCHGVMKESAFYIPKTSEKLRTFKILSGPGCSPATGTRRQIKVQWNSDGSKDNLSSYDIETLITKDGKRVKQTEPVFTDFDRADVPGDAKEVKEVKSILVRRKAQ